MRLTAASDDPVQDLYDAYPYPARNAGDEQRRLIGTVMDHLALLNHYGFAGQGQFDANFRALVAGGGTGDAAIFLAEQLREVDGQVVYLDANPASAAIAQRRAEARGLTNVQWVVGRLEELDAAGVAAFDYVNCSGVLHHLENPDAGLATLRNVLSERGVLAIMVYSRHARWAVGPVQEAIRLLCDQGSSLEDQLQTAKTLVDQLPPTNLFRQQRHSYQSELASGDAGYADLLLHPRERSYSVMELHEWLDGAGLSLIEFVSPIGQKRFYDPAPLLSGTPLSAKAAALSRRRRQAIADLVGQVTANHAFYCAREAKRPATLQPDMVPFFFPHLEHSASIAKELASGLAQAAAQGRSAFTLDLDSGPLELPCSPRYVRLAAAIDGRRTVREVIAQAKAELRSAGVDADTETLRRCLDTLYAGLNAADRLLLRHASVAPFLSPEALQQKSLAR